MPSFFFFNMTSFVPCCLKENSVQLSKLDTSFDGMYMLTCHQDGQFLLGCKIIAQILFIDRNLTANQGTALSQQFHCAFTIEKNGNYNGYYYGHCVSSR